jgi:HlyD family secretion protein
MPAMTQNGKNETRCAHMMLHIIKVIGTVIVLLLNASLGAQLMAFPPSQEGKPEPTPPANSSSSNLSISCLGRIAPEDGLIQVGARSISGQPSLVAELKVKEGDSVKVGQILAVLDSKEQLEAVLHEAEARVQLARDQLARTKAGPKSGDVTAQQEEIARLELQLRAEEADYQRYEPLVEKKIVSAAVVDEKRSSVEATRQMLKESKARLNSLTEIRQIDVDVAESDLKSAISSVERAKAEVKLSTIRSRVNGRVLKINAWPGEEVGSKGIMELARTGQMYVIAEVYETDAARVRVGQRATISGAALTKKLQGTVEQIGSKVARNNVTHLDPVAVSDMRVVEVKIRLEESQTVENLIHAQVTVLIQP